MPEMMPLTRTVRQSSASTGGQKAEKVVEEVLDLQATDSAPAENQISAVESLEHGAGVDYPLELFEENVATVATNEQLANLISAFPFRESKHPEWLNRLRFQYFSVYFRLYTIVLLANLAAGIYLAVRAVRDSERFSFKQATTAVAVNLFLSSAMRQSHCINLCFKVCTSLPLWMPLAIRRRAALVYCYGGIHSSCGIAAGSWYVVFAALVLKDYPGSGRQAYGLVVTTTLMFILFLTLIGLSHPSIRRRFHNLWEISHRLSGWVAIALFWVQTFLLAFSPDRSNRSSAVDFFKTPAVWFLLVVTVATIQPWLSTHKLEFEAERLSSRALRLHFKNQKLTTCLGVRLSHSPWRENHGFATIPEADGRTGFAVIMANNGDWTRNFIENPTEYVWSRGTPTMGVVRLAFLFRRIVIVGTGSGIGPCLSFFNVHPEWDVRVIWSTRDPTTCLGESVLPSILRADKDALLIDTKSTKKPDMAAIAYAVCRQSGAEAVVIISNPVATREVVYKLEVAGVPAYGAIWDS